MIKGRQAKTGRRPPASWRRATGRALRNRASTARNLAVQMRSSTLVQLLTASLGEEQNAAQLLDQLAQPLLSVARMPAAVE